MKEADEMREDNETLQKDIFDLEMQFRQSKDLTVKLTNNFEKVSRAYLDCVTEKQTLSVDSVDLKAKLQRAELIISEWNPKVQKMREEYKKREDIMQEVIGKMRGKFE